MSNTYVLSDEHRKIFLHKDRVHSTMKKENAAKFYSFDNAREFAERKFDRDVFEPVKYSELK